MELSPQILRAQVMHRRLAPKRHALSARLYYLVTPLPAAPLPSRIQQLPVTDLGPRDGQPLEPWARAILDAQGLGAVVARIVLVTMPRVLGYVFNPVSFYLCLDAQGGLRAVINEVHNTFGEQHSYLCARPDQGAISPDEWLEARKLFHVSPFFAREGRYRFRYALRDRGLGIWIDYAGADGQMLLNTALTGQLEPLDRGRLRLAFLAHPLVPLRAIALIHWHALRLVLRGIRYRRKPPQLPEIVTHSQDLAKM